VQGYDVQTSDGESVGKVVGERGDSIVVEHGLLFKSRHAVPRAFAHVDADEGIVRLSISKQLVADSPKLSDDVDDDAIATYYGLAGADTRPPTRGYGEVNPDDPAAGAEQQELAAGREPAAAERARIREREL